MKRPGSSTSSTGPVPLSSLLDKAVQHLRSIAPEVQQQGDGLLYAGNRHDSVPRALFNDRRLTPLERNAWQVIRMQLNDDGVSAFPGYEHLRAYLTSMPCSDSGRASDETVARALTVLRLTRWLTLVRHRRDTTTGRIQGNLYVLHDEPLTPYEAIQLDPKYLELVSHGLTHASKAIQRVGHHALKEITEDPLLSGRVLPSRLHILAQRLASQSWADETPSSESEEGETSGDSPLRNPKTDSTVRTVRTDLIKEEDVRTVPRARETSGLQLPERFARLRSEQQAGALAALRQVPIDLQQPVLDEWDARCRASNVRNPAAYLFGIIQKALRGDFHARAGQRAADRSQHPVPSTVSKGAPAQTPASREVAEEYIAKLKAMFPLQDRQQDHE